MQAAEHDERLRSAAAQPVSGVKVRDALCDEAPPARGFRVLHVLTARIAKNDILCGKLD